MVPYYNKPTQEGLYRHFKAIAEAVDIPNILYNVPGRTVADLANDTMLRLAQIPNIVGVKDATGNIERGTDLIKRVPKGFAVYSGDDATGLALILMGGHGVISVTANVAPRLMHEMCAAALAGDVERAREINCKLLGLHKHLFVEANPIPVKWARAAARSDRGRHQAAPDAAVRAAITKRSGRPCARLPSFPRQACASWRDGADETGNESVARCGAACPHWSAGCSFGELLEGKKVEYKSAGKLPPLEIPPDLTRPGRDERYQVPDATPSGSATFSAYNADRSGASRNAEVLPQARSVRLERDGSTRFLVVVRAAGEGVADRQGVLAGERLPREARAARGRRDGDRLGRESRQDRRRIRSATPSASSSTRPTRPASATSSAPASSARSGGGDRDLHQPSRHDRAGGEQLARRWKVRCGSRGRPIPELEAEFLRRLMVQARRRGGAREVAAHRAAPSARTARA